MKLLIWNFLTRKDLAMVIICNYNGIGHGYIMEYNFCRIVITLFNIFVGLMMP
jgi:hypothetical protein